MRVQHVVALFGAVVLAGCSKGSSNNADAAPLAEAKPVIQLPAPFSDVKLGMTQAELEAKFPPSEDISHCEPLLVGGDSPRPPQVPGADKKAHSWCARGPEIGDLNIHDMVQSVTTVKELGAADSDNVIAGSIYTYAQVRGAIRAGVVSEAALLQADRGRSQTAYGALTNVVDNLFRGGFTFANAHMARREVCAVIADSCDDTDPARLRKYVEGGYSLGQIDADAHARVVNGKCRGPYLQHEKALARTFVRRAGAFGGIGLARATRPDRTLVAEDANSFSVYSSRSQLDAAPAKFGVLVANALPDAEKYWSGTVALVPVEGADWLGAVVWLRGGHVTRVLLNVVTDEKFGELPKTLAAFYGSPGTTTGTVTTWPLPGGVTARLDIGAATSLVVESTTAVASTAATTLTRSVPSATSSAWATIPTSGAGGATPAASGGWVTVPTAPAGADR